MRNTPGNCMGDSFDWLVTFTYFLGDLLWQPAVFCLLFDAMNHHFEAECVNVLLPVPLTGPCRPCSLSVLVYFVRLCLSSTSFGCCQQLCNLIDA